MVILSADDWVCIFWFVCCLDEASCTGCYWWLGNLGLVFKWFALCEFSLLILPRVSSLVAQDLGVSATTSKAQCLISAAGTAPEL